MAPIWIIQPLIGAVEAVVTGSIEPAAPVSTGIGGTSAGAGIGNGDFLGLQRLGKRPASDNRCRGRGGIGKARSAHPHHDGVPGIGPTLGSSSPAEAICISDMAPRAMRVSAAAGRGL